MPFSNADYQSIITILELSPDEYRPNSTLRAHGQDLETLDTQEGSTFVIDVQQAIADWQSANTAYQSAIASEKSSGVQSQSIPGEYSVSWGSRGALAKYDYLLMTMRNAEFTITRLLKWHNSSKYTGRVGRTIS